MDKVLITVGSGGKKSQSFIKEEILSRFYNEKLAVLADGALIDNDIIITTDAFTVFPPFFDGGNIGKLAMCGMINDLASMGAEPKYMSMSLVIEEGFSLEKLRLILDEMKFYCEKFNIKLVSGDTKVVEKNKLEGLIINVTGIGKRYKNILLPQKVYKPGDCLVLTGPVGEHSIAVLRAKGVVNFDGNLNSDVAPLWEPVKALIDEGIKIKFIRDVTRGGLSAVLNELAIFANIKLEICEERIPVNDIVASVCEIYGFDIYSLACEGRLVIVVPEEDAKKTIEILKGFTLTEQSEVIGRVVETGKCMVVLNTVYGGKTILDMPLGEILPRIC